MKRTLLIAGACLLLGACSWFGGDKEDEEEPPAELTSFKATLKVKRLWSAKIGDGSENLRLGLRPTTDGAKIYAATHDGRVAAFDAESGKKIWSVELDLPLASGPSFGDGILVVGSSDGDLVALEVADGATRWKLKLGSEVLARPLITRNNVVVRTVDGHLRALDARDGAEHWYREREMPRLTLRGNATPAIAGDRIIVAYDDGKVSALNLRNGDTVWEVSLASQRGRTELERLADVDGDVQVVGNDVYVVGYQSRAAMLTVESGQMMWAQDLSSFNSPGVDWTNVYVTDSESEVVALDRLSGGHLWRQSQLRLRSLTGPTPHGNAVVVGDFEGYLHWLSATDGSFLARVKVGGEAVTSAPILVGDALYVQTEDGSLSAYRVSG